ncbi:hypothetical protein [Bradyrhizobium sp. NBAIM08]|uniref:hypothetical protein n=1 Tax=Bradyrhizobium sp. NBAIM08 TaxID=2793815 RepID=UPI001CD7D7F8|nr:hypothetical protein [Bradyrhizobium sp. NBAIM08]MCA1479814.1 hypothetical protein [Bradyrhizobium sp. NBAIM08]
MIDDGDTRDRVIRLETKVEHLTERAGSPGGGTLIDSAADPAREPTDLPGLR